MSCRNALKRSFCGRGTDAALLGSRRASRHAVFSAYAHNPLGRREAPQTAKRAAPFDPTGYWVAQITEDWRYRISAAPKGDAGGIPVNAAGRRAAAAWDPGNDAAAGEACKAYGAGGILRMPGRLHITWEGDDV